LDHFNPTKLMSHGYTFWQLPMRDDPDNPGQRQPDRSKFPQLKSHNMLKGDYNILDRLNYDIDDPVQRFMFQLRRLSRVSRFSIRQTLGWEGVQEKDARDPYSQRISIRHPSGMIGIHRSGENEIYVYHDPARDIYKSYLSKAARELFADERGSWLLRLRLNEKGNILERMPLQDALDEQNFLKLEHKLSESKTWEPVKTIDVIPAAELKYELPYDPNKVEPRAANDNGGLRVANTAIFALQQSAARRAEI
jgi:hypothetical protein